MQSGTLHTVFSLFSIFHKASSIKKFNTLYIWGESLAFLFSVEKQQKNKRIGNSFTIFHVLISSLNDYDTAVQINFNTYQ